MDTLFRSLIFVPGNNERFLAKAKNLEADIACLDLEDSVPISEKTKARALISDALDSGAYGPTVFVRVNGPGSTLLSDDLSAIVPHKPTGIVVPKVDTAKDVADIMRRIGDLEVSGHTTYMAPSIESAAGAVNAYGIASAHPGVCCVVFGIFDLLYDMGIEYTKDPNMALYSRSKIAVDAAAAGVPAIDCIWQDMRDTAGFERDCTLGRSLGYAGKSLIHPDQIDIAHKAFTPTQSEIDWARRVCDTYEDAIKAGRGAVRLDGKMIDEVHYKQAVAVVRFSNPTV